MLLLNKPQQNQADRRFDFILKVKIRKQTF